MSVLPLVSICTPTFNRRPFIPSLIQCVINQTYPAHLIEWVITDDGTDPIEDLVKEVRGVNTYNKVIDSSFTELVPAAIPAAAPETVTVEDFFRYYDQLFFNIPANGASESHESLIARSQEYIGGSILDPEKQALIEEINTLRQQILDLSQTYLTINKVL